MEEAMSPRTSWWNKIPIWPGKTLVFVGAVVTMAAIMVHLLLGIVAIALELLIVGIDLLRRNPPSTARPMIEHLPDFPFSCFTGRTKETAALRLALAEDGVAVVVPIQDLSGQDGIGKTALALAYAKEHREEHDIVWWVRAGHPETIIEDYARLAKALGAPATGLSGEEIIDLVRVLLTGWENWLLILDGVQDQQLLDLHRATTGNGQVIVTSPHRNWTTTTTGASPSDKDITQDAAKEEAQDSRLEAPIVEIGLLPLTDAAQLLHDRRGHGEKQATKELAQELGRIPLALEIAAATMHPTPNPTMHLSIPQYTERYRAQRARLVAEKTVGEGSFPENTAAQDDTSLILQTVTELARETFKSRHPLFAEAAENLLDLCAWLAPENISCHLFAAHPELLDTPLATMVRKEEHEEGSEGVHEKGRKKTGHEPTATSFAILVQDLQNCSLLGPGFPELTSSPQSRLSSHTATHTTTGEVSSQESPTAQTAKPATDTSNTPRTDIPKEFSLHELVQRALREHQPAAQQQHSLQQAFTLLEKSLPAGDQSSPLAPTERAQWSRLAPHLLGLAGHLQEHSLDPGLSARAYFQIARYHAQAHRYDEATRIAAQVATDYAEIFGPDDPLTLTCRHDLAFYLASAGYTEEARRLEEEVVASREQVLGRNHPDTLAGHRQLARCYAGASQYEEAVRLQEQVLKEEEDLFGPDHADTLTSRHQLALYYDHTNRHEKAVETQKQVLADCTRLLGADQPSTLESRHNLARYHAHAGHYDKALRSGSRARDDYERIFGTAHPDTLRSTHYLAQWQDQLGHHKKALALQIGVLEGRKNVLGPTHPDTLTSQQQLALYYDHTGQHDEALALQIGVLEEQENILGPTHPDTLTSQQQLALYYDHTGQHDEALALQITVLERQENLLGPTHPDTLTSRQQLADFYEHTWRLEEATRIREGGKPVVFSHVSTSPPAQAASSQETNNNPAENTES